jgi:aryl-alcohol dehydrogenase-like predicted oxidoreductase
MKRRRLGAEGPLVSVLGLGCHGMSNTYGPSDDAESIRTLHRALDLGVTLIDSANAYGQGTNEQLVGEVVRQRRRDVVLATKFGLVPSADRRGTDVDGRPERARRSCEASLARFGVDVIDIYYLHRVDPKVPIEETIGGMADLVREGKVRFLGLSEVEAQTLRRAVEVHPIAAVQSEFSLWSREPEQTMLETCRELGVGFVAYSPLGRGFLTGALTDPEALDPGDVRRLFPRFQPQNFGHNLSIVQRLEAHARALGCAPSQLALAWLLHKGEHVVPIPGTTSRPHLEENLAAADIVLTTEDMRALDDMFSVGVAAGERYGPARMRFIERETAEGHTHPRATTS